MGARPAALREPGEEEGSARLVGTAAGERPVDRPGLERRCDLDLALYRQGAWTDRVFRWQLRGAGAREQDALHRDPRRRPHRLSLGATSAGVFPAEVDAGSP